MVVHSHTVILMLLSLCANSFGFFLMESNPVHTPLPLLKDSFRFFGLFPESKVMKVD